jgi:hypothetical protein
MAFATSGFAAVASYKAFRHLEVRLSPQASLSLRTPRPAALFS